MMSPCKKNTFEVAKLLYIKLGTLMGLTTLIVLYAFSSTNYSTTKLNKEAVKKCRVAEGEAFRVLDHRDCLGPVMADVYNQALTQVIEKVVGTFVHSRTVSYITIEHSGRGVKEKEIFASRTEVWTPGWIEEVRKKECKFKIDSEHNVLLYECYVQAKACVVQIKQFPGSVKVLDPRQRIERQEFTEGEKFALEVDLATDGYIAVLLESISGGGSDSVYLIYPCPREPRQGVFHEGGRHLLFTEQTGCSWVLTSDATGAVRFIILYSDRHFSLENLPWKQEQWIDPPALSLRNFTHWFIENSSKLSHFSAAYQFVLVKPSNQNTH